MKIASSQVTASSSRTSIQYESRSINATIKQPKAEAPKTSDTVDLTQSKQAEKDTGTEVKNTVKDAAKEAEENLKNLYENTAKSLNSKRVGMEPQSFAKDLGELKLRMLDLLFYALTGKRFKFQQVENTQQESQSSGLDSQLLAQSARPEGRRIELSMNSLSYESESISYSAQAEVRAADGKSISIDIGFSMSREFSTFTSIEMGWNGLSEEGKRLCDPLVINYGGTAMSLTDQKFDFDLDSDGVMDKISFAGQGSGFLALDKNGDGEINDGSELFGPTDGNGFNELRAYDNDSNGWIDENDDVYSQLRIWSKDADGNDQLFTLKELDVGAIYLGDISTEFSINDANNVNQGVMRSTSFFLKDSGGAGYVSHVDLSI